MSDKEFLESGGWNALLPMALVTVFVILLNLINKFWKESHLRVLDKQHSWRTINSDNESFRCTICEGLMIKNDGVFCDSCGVSVDLNCLNKVSGRFKCKEVVLDSDRPMKHRWLKGNVTEGNCDVCNAECVDDDLRCIWCHRTLHSQCLHFFGEVCDFGKLRPVMLPPTHIKRRTGQRLHAVIPPNIPDWRPLFVIGNRKSGSQIGEAVLSGFRYLLNPLQVCELSRRFLERLGFLLSLLPDSARPIVLVAGGDGTVAAVLTALYSNKHKIKCEFGVGIVPLGTGNDMSRVLGWGKEEPSPLSPLSLINTLLAAQPLKVDRWRVERGWGLGQRESFMYNYMSVGVDARVTLDFHKAREASTFLRGRLINKALYLAFGTQQVVERGLTGLEKVVELELDGVKVALPEVEAVVILNIPSWGAGCLLWQLKEAEEEVSEQLLDDGLLEVVGIYSSFHMAQLQVGLSTPYRIGQASNIKITLKKKLPMQVDGEPWLQPPGLVEVTSGGQVTLLEAQQHSFNTDQGPSN